MASGIVRQMTGELTKAKKSGKKLVKAIGSTFAQSKIAKAMPKTQPCKKGGKKKY
jgi:hypothetical protein